MVRSSSASLLFLSGLSQSRLRAGLTLFPCLNLVDFPLSAFLLCPWDLSACSLWYGAPSLLVARLLPNAEPSYQVFLASFFFLALVY